MASSTFFQSISWALAAVATVANAQIATAATTRMTSPPVLSLLPGDAPNPLTTRRLNKQSLHIVPANDVHEGVDVARRLGTEVHVIGVLVHIEREHRRAARQGVAMIRSPLIDELAVAR